jgi:hypothetical protein
MSKSKIEKILICFLDIRDIIHIEFVPEETIVHLTFHVMLKRLIDAVRCKCGELWRDHSLTLYYDNVLAHSLLQMS